MKMHHLCAWKWIITSYQKYYNEQESWATSLKLLKQWDKIYGIEYMLFAMTCAIKEGRRVSSFFNFRNEVLNYLNYKEKYEVYNNPDKYTMYDIVRLSKKQEADLYSEYSEKVVKTYISKIEDYCKQSGKIYHDYEVTIKQWIERDREKQLDRHG